MQNERAGDEPDKGGRPDDGAEAKPDRALDSEERLRAIVNTAVEGIITIDEEGIVESINPAVETIFGYTPAELIGKNISLLMPSPYREEHDGYLRNYLRSGKAKIIGIGREVVGLRKDGSIFPMDLSVGEVKLRGRKRMFTGIVRDITERKRLEREVLDISDAEQRRIGQDLHDDLCQNLAAVELMSEVLEQKLEARKQPEAAQAARIAEQVRKAISHTRVLARGLSPLELEVTGLPAALRELAANSENLFPIVCRFECPRPMHLSDGATITHVYRIVQEAISNAVKHGRATEVNISLDVEGEQCSVSVADNGAGFVPAREGRGMGLRIMRYRAGVIGASLEFMRRSEGGTIMLCKFQKPRQN